MSFRNAGYNLAVLMFVILPLLVTTYAVIIGISPPPWVGNGGFHLVDYAMYLLYQYVILVPPFILGGVLQHLVLWVAPVPRSERRYRLLILTTTLAIPLSLVMLHTSLEKIAAPSAGLPLGIALLGYGLIARNVKN